MHIWILIEKLLLNTLPMSVVRKKKRIHDRRRQEMMLVIETQFILQFNM